MYFLKGPSNFKFTSIHYSKLCHLLFNGQSNSHQLLHVIHLHKDTEDSIVHTFTHVVTWSYKIHSVLHGCAHIHTCWTCSDASNSILHVQVQTFTLSLDIHVAISFKKQLVDACSHNVQRR